MTDSLKKHLSWMFTVVATTIALMPGQADAAWTVGDPIVTYFAGPGMNPTNAQQMADGGWNLVWANTEEELNVAESHGLRAMWTGSLDNAAVIAIRNNPALYSYYVKDEPSAADFSGLADTVSRLKALDPNHMAYINLFPNYASPAQLGIGTSFDDAYPLYLNTYISTVKPQLLSYDHYQFKVGADTPDYFKNLAIISHTAKEAGIPFINIVQASSFDPSVRIPNGNELRYLYNTSLAYGAAGVSDFYYQVTLPGFTGGMALADGTTTPLYDAAKTINPIFAADAAQVQSLHHIGAYHLGDLPWGWNTDDGTSPMRLPGNAPFQLTPGIPNTDYVPNEPVEGAVLGFWGPDDLLAHATRTLVVNLDYTHGLNTRVTGPGNLSIFDPALGQWIAQGHPWADISLLPGGGILVGLTLSIPEPSTMILCVTSILGLLGYRLKGKMRFRSAVSNGTKSSP